MPAPRSVSRCACSSRSCDAADSRCGVEGFDDEIYDDRAAMERTDLIVQSVTMSTISDFALAGLRSAVERGTGLAGWHGGIADAYRNSSDYLQLVGGQFLIHPAREPAERAGGESDNFLDHTVEVTATGRASPIMAGIDDFALRTEQYWVLSDDLNDVLATTTHPVRRHEPWRRLVTSPRSGRARGAVAAFSSLHGA